MIVCIPGRHSRAEEKAETKDRMKELLTERVTVARAIHEQLVEKFARGGGNIEAVHRAKIALLQAQLGLAETREDRLKIYEEMVKDAKDWEQRALRNVEKGAWEPLDFLAAKSYRIDVEIGLEKVKAEPETLPPPKK
jgi:hypothetical protein